jgi:hypothetical protein
MTSFPTSVITVRNGFALPSKVEVSSMRKFVFASAMAISLVSAAVAQSDSTSLGDVARQSRNHTATAKKVWNDESEDISTGTGDGGSPCGAPLTTVPIGSTSALLGKSLPVDDPIAKSLVKWLEKHPDLDSMAVDNLSKISFPRSPEQSKANAYMASQEVDRWVAETVAAKEDGPEKVNGVVTDIMNTRNSAAPSSVVATAVEKERDRRNRSDGSQADKISEAINLYTICENRRMAQMLDDVDALAKADFRKRIETAVKEAQAQQSNGLQ